MPRRYLWTEKTAYQNRLTIILSVGAIVVWQYFRPHTPHEASIESRQAR